MGVLGSKNDNTVTQKECDYDKERGQQVCRFAEKDIEKDQIKKEAVIRTELDENGDPKKVSESASGYDEQEITKFKAETKKKARQNSGGRGGALSGNTEI